MDGTVATQNNDIWQYDNCFAQYLAVGPSYTCCLDWLDWLLFSVLLTSHAFLLFLSFFFILSSLPYLRIPFFGSETGF